MKYQVKSMFASLLHMAETELDPSVKEFCIKERQNDPQGRIVSNEGGWQSNGMKKDTPIRKVLYDYIDKFISQTTRNQLQISNYWININKNKSFNNPHIHSGAQYSGVLYVQVPENSGSIYFQNPNGFAQYHELANYTDEFAGRANATLDVVLEPWEGLFIMFPASVIHGVYANNSEEERISIAFNARVRE